LACARCRRNCLALHDSCFCATACPYPRSDRKNRWQHALAEDPRWFEGEKKIIVTPTTAITAVAPGNKDELKPGAQIIIMASDKQPDGSVLAKTLYVGRSLTPAM